MQVDWHVCGLKKMVGDVAFNGIYI